ncbi:MAG: MtrAB system histidine kinase MtrB [Actinomycetes bacterium]
MWHRLVHSFQWAKPPFSWIKKKWRGSLLLRITAITLLASGLVITVLGFSLLSKVSTGLMDTKQQSSLSEATAGHVEAQRVIETADAAPTAPSPALLADDVVSNLASRSGSPAQFDVLLLASIPGQQLPERGTNLVSTTSISENIRKVLADTQEQSWVYGPINYIDGTSVPGLIVGAPLRIKSLGEYNLFYLFPLTQEQQTLDLVRSSVVITGILLLILLAVIARIVTRLVVNPVRQAAQTAALLTEGQLSERMPVRGDDELAQLATTFNDMAASLQQQIKQLEELSRVQQRFVADVSHELRTPLTTVRMAADLMFENRADFDPITARASELLQNQLDRFEALLNDLLEISRFDAGVAALEIESWDLADLIDRAVEFAEPLAIRTNTPVQVIRITNVNLITADQRRIYRIVRNLLENAIEHSEGRKVEISVAVSEDAAAVTVRDFGVGLRPGEASLVFNRFWRADPARARTMGGSGLGLSIAFEDARLHGGWLEAWGEPGQGSCFRLSLPRIARGSFSESPLPLIPEGFIGIESSTSSGLFLDAVPQPPADAFRFGPKTGGE